MMLFKDMVKYMNFDHLIVLSGSQPLYIIDLYIKALHCKKILIHEIQVNDINQFVQFIDQYPSDVLSIDLIEGQLINYFNENRIRYDQSIHDICMKYKLKRMCVEIHNHIYSSILGGLIISPQVPRIPRFKLILIKYQCFY